MSALDQVQVFSYLQTQGLTNSHAATLTEIATNDHALFALYCSGGCAKSSVSRKGKLIKSGLRKENEYTRCPVCSSKTIMIERQNK